MLVCWDWKSFFRAFGVTFITLCLATACGMGIQKVFDTMDEAYGALNQPLHAAVHIQEKS